MSRFESIMETETVVVRNRHGKVIDELYIDKDLAPVARFLVERFIPVRCMFTQEGRTQPSISISFEHTEDIRKVKMPRCHTCGVGMVFYYSSEEERQKFVKKFSEKCYKQFGNTYRSEGSFECYYPSRADVQGSIDFMKWAGDETDEDLDDPEYDTVEWYDRIRHLNRLAEKYGEEFDN